MTVQDTVDIHVCCWCVRNLYEMDNFVTDTSLEKVESILHRFQLLRIVTWCLYLLLLFVCLLCIVNFNEEKIVAEYYRP